METVDVPDGISTGRSTVAPAIAYRRIIFAACVLVSIGAMVVVLAEILWPPNALAVILIVAFAVNVTWVALGFWNAAIGFCLRRGSPVVAKPAHGAIASRTAIVMTMHNEDGSQSIARLRATKRSLDAESCGKMFDYYVLSDSSKPDAIAGEEAAYARWRLAEPEQLDRIHYRRRTNNWGYKPGNIREFCAAHGTSYDYLVLLDADSVMDGQTVSSLVTVMEHNPKLGILQTLIVGILCPSSFARVFEFGHRLGLRCSIAGAAWWQVDRCQYWGHNAIIRLKPFIEFCEMPHLPGKGPFGGHILCHDQIEASFIHRAGYEVRVLTQESGSYEGVPPTLIDFLKRNHRWCRGNLKNLKLVGAPGLKTIDRFHLAVVAQRFLAFPALAIFIVAAAAMACGHTQRPFAHNMALAVLISWLAMFFAPKIFGIIDASWTSPERYGGVSRLVSGGAVELVFTLLLTIICAVETTVFIMTVSFQRNSPWEPQERDGHALSWHAALKAFWLPSVLGAVLLACLYRLEPAAIAWFTPVLIGLFLAIPLAKFGASQNEMFGRSGVCTLPEEIDIPAVIADVIRATRSE